MATNHLAEGLLEVAVLRFRLQDAQEALAGRRAAFDAQHAGLIRDVRDLSEQLALAEAAIKLDAVNHFLRTGEKKPCAGLEVKLFRALDYDASEALAWAKAHPEKGLLALDRKLYEKLLKLARENDLPDWADAPGTLSDDPRAQIAGDLTKVFPIEEIAAAGSPPEKLET